jgi:hypothetical protein
MARKTAEPDVGQLGANLSLVQPAFPTRRAIVGGAMIAGVASPRDGAAILFHNDRVWVFGGSASKEPLDLGDVAHGRIRQKTEPFSSY